MEYLCYFDGSYRDHNDIEDMGIGCVVYDSSHTPVFEMSQHYDCEGSTNYAEYSACIEVLKWVSNNTYDKVLVRGDSKLVINQLKGEWKVRKGVYTEKAKEAKELFNGLSNIEVKWTSRNNNVRADELSKMGLNGENYYMNLKN